MESTTDRPPAGKNASLCPNCRRNKVVLLKSMAKYSSLDWYKCNGCEHIFTRPRGTDDPKAA